MTTTITDNGVSTTAVVSLPEEVSTDNLPVVAGAMEIQSPDNIRPVRPTSVSNERDAELRKEAQKVAEAIIANPSDVEITAHIYGLGREAESANTDNIELVNTTIGPIMGEVSTDSVVGKTLTEITGQLDLVNPHVVAKTVGEFEQKFLLFFRRTVDRLPKSDELMGLINERRDSVAETIDKLKRHLWEERDKALKNAIQLSLVANRLADAQQALQEAAYQGQLIWAHLNEARAKEADQVRKQALDYLATDLAMKVVDIQTVDQLNIQSRMGAETLVNNCRGIEMLVGRVTNTLLPSVQTALVVKAAASQQAQLAAHARGITAAAGSTIRQTAADIRQVSVDVAKQNTEAVISLEDLEAAADEYIKMEADIKRVMSEAESNARGLSNRMSILNERMTKVADPLTEARRAKEAAGV